MPDKKLFLLDAMALIYRAHFAFSKNPRINSKGMNTGAVLGFTNSLLEIINKQKPTHLGVAFDTPEPTFRHVAYPEYKAHREAQPEDITQAIPIVKQLTKAFNIPVLELPGYEADDIIGTFAKQASKAGFEVYMMTPDKDYAQLVEEHVYLYKPAYMGNGVDILGIPEVLAKWNISRVEQVVDMLGLQGDSADNIPGIPGIGPKTAAKLLAAYDSVEGIIENVGQLKGKQKERVEENKEQAVLSKQLALIDTNVPMEFDEEALKYTSFNEAELRPIFEELEFRTLGRRLFGDGGTASSTKKPTKKTSKPSSGQMSLFGTAAKATPAQDASAVVAQEIQTIDTTTHQYWLVDTPNQRKELIKYLLLQDEICFDTETDRLQAYEAKLVGLAFSYLKSDAYYVPIPEEEQEAQFIVEEFREVFESEQVAKVAQNAKYDVMVLQNYGIQVKGKIFDTMLAHYLIAPEKRHNMDILAETLLNYKPVSITTLIGKKGKKQKSMRDVPPSDVAEYAGEDADITLQLKEILAPQVAEIGVQKLFEEVEVPLISTLAQVEANGVKIDVDFLNNYSAELAKEVEVIEKEIYELAGEEFTISSPKQLGIILFEKLALMEKPKKTKTGQYATGEEILVTLAPKHDIVQKILEFRQLQKLKSTYVDALPSLISPKDGLIHTSYNQAVAATGRLSSTDPNLQNIPIRTDRGREIRKAFVPRSEEFILMAADYSQIELRIMAEFSKDEHMIEAFKNKRDIHATTASKIFKVPLEEVDSEMRRRAKTANFGIIYGISAFGLSQRLNIPRKEASQIIDAYFEEFPSIKKYMDEVINFARENGYVETIMGRRRYLRDINSRNFTTRGFAERNAINTPIQGSAADLIKVAMINIQNWMNEAKLKSKMIMQVHDELVFDAHKDELALLKQKVPELMINAIDFSVPLDVEVGLGHNWLEAH
ncbi:MAG: DNA polymerase I [Flammeovirgaceae bacterium]